MECEGWVVLRVGGWVLGRVCGRLVWCAAGCGLVCSCLPVIAPQPCPQARDHKRLERRLVECQRKQLEVRVWGGEGVGM